MVSTYLKPCDLISLIGLGSNHNNWNISLLPVSLNYFSDIKAINSGQHQVKNYKVIIILFDKVQRVFTAARCFYPVPVLGKVVINKLKNILFIVNNQNFFFHINISLILM